MKSFIVPCLMLAFFACKKKDIVTGNQAPELTIKDSALLITKVTKADINEMNIDCQLNPAASDVYNDVYLHWSTTPDFSRDKDSMLLTYVSSGPRVYTGRLTGLKQATNYYSRISIVVKNKRFYSSVKPWSTDTLNIISLGTTPMPAALVRNEEINLITNFASSPGVNLADTKILIGQTVCPILWDNGNNIRLRVPSSLLPGKYIFELQRKGLTVRPKDSIQILSGVWNTIPSPVFPIDPSAATSGMYWFGTSTNGAKGWIVGGNLFNGAVPTDFPEEQMKSGYIYEFNALQQQWTKRLPNNRQYLENPHCYYYNNSIYVIAGMQTEFSSAGYGLSVDYHNLRRMKRLDLGTFTWHDMDTLPYPNIHQTASFELNNEWYVGMGNNHDSIRACCGTAYPSKKFWKYNPATNQWKRLADFPGGHQFYPTLFSVGYKGYAYFGAIPVDEYGSNTDLLQELWEYNPAANQWTRIPLPAIGGPPPGEKCQIVSHNGKAYFFTSQKRSLGVAFYYVALQNTCYEYDPVTNQFKQLARMTEGNIIRLIGKIGDKFYFQSDALGYYERIPNRTYSFQLE